MDANEIQHQIEIDEMMRVLEDLGGQPVKVSDNEIVSKTICHSGDSHKLYYYDNSKRFTCYTGDCGYGFSVYDLICMVKNVEFFEALCYLTDFLGIKSSGGYVPRCDRIETRFFNKFKNKEVGDVNLPDYNPEILNCFRELYHISWINDNITTKTMKKFNIRFNVLENQIIIPHYYKDDSLVGVRVRNLDPARVEKGQKYMPLYYNGQSYKHDIRGNLYGLNFNQYNIQGKRQIIIFEAEKSVMQLEGYWTDNNSVALGSSNLHNEQIKLIHELGIDEVILAFDKEYKQSNTQEEVDYVAHIRRRFVNQLLPFYRVSIVMDRENLLDYKDSPTDKGKEVWNHLYKNRYLIQQPLRN